MVILTHKIDTLIVLTTFLKKCEKKQKRVIYRDGGSIYIYITYVTYDLFKVIFNFQNTRATLRVESIDHLRVCVDLQV